MEIPRHWRLQKQRYALISEVCPRCQEKIFPPREVCPHCGGAARLAHEVFSFERLALAPAAVKTLEGG